MHSSNGYYRLVKKFKSDPAQRTSQGSSELSEQQSEEVVAALKEADAGDFATAEEVERVMNKWRRAAR
jgi:predicted transcriptional regulator